MQPRRPDAAFVLSRPLRDYDDSAFVWSNAGKSNPREIGVARLARMLSGYDVVFYGESHGHSGVQRGEMQVLRALYERDPKWVLSLEQFERDVQPVVDDYLAGRKGEAALIGRGRAWSNYATSYRPLLVFAARHHLPVIAAEAPSWIIRCVGQAGIAVLDRLTPLERSWVAGQINAGPGAYHDEYMSFLSSSAVHGGGPSATDAPLQAALAAQRSFEAQATRDDTMAESIDRAWRDHPGYKILHVTGSFHAAKFLGTVERLQSRNPALRIAVIDALEVEDPAAPAAPAAALGQATVLQLVYPTPDQFVEGEDPSGFIGAMEAKHAAGKCKYTAAE